MRIDDLLRYHHPPNQSFEIDPPKTVAGMKKLIEGIRNYGRAADFVSVTYHDDSIPDNGARWVILEELVEANRIPLVHVTSKGKTLRDIDSLIYMWLTYGVQNVLVIQGDHDKAGGDFPTAKSLVEYLARNTDLCIGVAGYPQVNPDPRGTELDLLNLQRKIEAGANFVLTQLFFENEDFYTFRDNLATKGIKIPVIAGLMPLVSKRRLEFSERIGIDVPDLLKARILAAKTEEAAREIGVLHAQLQVDNLRKVGADGIHLYTRNNLELIPQIFGGIRLI